VAGTIGGATVGVAKGVKLVSADRDVVGQTRQWRPFKAYLSVPDTHVVGLLSSFQSRAGGRPIEPYPPQSSCYDAYLCVASMMRIIVCSWQLRLLLRTGPECSRQVAELQTPTGLLGAQCLANPRPSQHG